MNPFIEHLSRWLDQLFGRHKRRAAPEPRYGPPSPKPSLELDHVVVHECGHASIAWMSPAVAFVNGIEFHRGGGTTRAGFISSRTDYPQEVLVYTLGGLVGELLLRGKVHTSGLAGTKEADLPTALRQAEAVLSATTPERLGRAWGSRLAAVSFDVAALFVRRPHRDVAAVLNLAYRRGKHLLSANRAGFERLCRLAAGRRGLSRSDIESQFGPRLWAPGSPSR